MTLREQLRADVLDLCFDTEDLAVSVTHAPDGAEQYQIPALKRTPYEDAEVGSSTVMSSDMIIRVPLDKVLSPFGPKCRIIINNVSYKIRKAEPDREEITTILYLTKAVS